MPSCARSNLASQTSSGRKQTKSNKLVQRRLVRKSLRIQQSVETKSLLPSKSQEQMIKMHRQAACTIECPTVSIICLAKPRDRSRDILRWHWPKTNSRYSHHRHLCSKVGKVEELKTITSSKPSISISSPVTDKLSRCKSPPLQPCTKECKKVHSTSTIALTSK